MSPKVSIIVPVYKVEKYLNKCVDSILNQTFKDFEVILVDDGSPDNCGNICDEYAKKDNRVVVIHKENGGQATARNAALDIARGEYIGFVDSDDWIEPDMYELLYKICTENKCDVANCSSKIYYKNKTVINGGHQLIVHDKKEAMRALLIGELYDECLWTKLIKKDLLKDIRIPVGIAYEDTAFAYKFIDKAEKVCCIGEAKYNYIKREESTMDRAVKEVKIDAVFIYEEMYGFIKDKYLDLIDLVVVKLANNALILLNLISKSENFNKYKNDYYEVANLLNKHFMENMKVKEYPRNLKIILLATKVNPLFYKLINNKISRR